MDLFGTSSAPEASLLDLPLPDKDAIEHSQKVTTRIQQEIHNQGGSINFCRFMELALYEPGLGYYAAGSQKLGQSGDFITAPELSKVFTHCLAQQLHQVLREIDHCKVLEIGPGSGIMACEILQELERLNCLPEEYTLLERSADLRERQKQYINNQLPHLAGIIRWIDELPKDKFNGVIIANEVMDALPVHRFMLDQHEIKEICVSIEKDNFIWIKKSPGKQLLNEIEIELGNIEAVLLDGYISEINIQIPSWISTFSELLSQGVILLIDYGYTRQEYYHTQRINGSLLCHYRHRVHTDPFLYPGLQDITSSINFTQIADAGLNAGMDICGYTTQAHFLMSCGLEEVVNKLMSIEDIDRLIISNQVQILTMPGEMGERFKVLGLVKNFDSPLIGFQYVNHRNRL